MLPTVAPIGISHQKHHKYKHKIQETPINMSNYNTELKEKSPMKLSINNFLGKFSTPQTRAIVIDAETLLSSSTLVSYGVDPLNIVVLNDDASIIEAAHKRGHTQSIAGISSAVLPKLHGSYDIIYLDYCGFPDIRSDGFNPAYDILWSGDRLADDGIMVVTFSRRATNCVEKAEAMIPVSLELVKSICYSETCAMFAMILTKGKKQRHIRDTFNQIKIDTHKRKRDCVEESQPSKKKKNSSWKETYDRLVAERMKDALPDTYSLIVYYWRGHLSPGIVERKAGQRRRVLWVDSASPNDYGVAEGYFPFGKHVNLADADHDKSDYNWAYYYDTFEVVSEEDMMELKTLPIKIKPDQYKEIKERVQMSKQDETYPILATYFGVKLA